MVTQLVLLIMVLKVYMNQLPDSAINVVYILVLHAWDFEFFEVAKGLHCVETSGEVVENDTENFHEGHVVKLENGTFSDVNLDVSALKSCALEDESIFLFGMIVDYSHLVTARRADSRIRQHSFGDHPSHGASERFGDPENV